MRTKIKYMLILFGIFFFFLFIIFIINQTVQVIALCHSLHPVFGESVKYFLLFVYALVILFSLYHFFLLPKPLKLPAGRNARDYDEFLIKTWKRLAKNKNVPEHIRNRMISLKNENPEVEVLAQEIRQAEKELAKEANRQIKETSQAIFISTAISQSGS